MDPTRLTPDEARARFGELLDPRTRTHSMFSEPDGGLWRPEYDSGPAGLVLRGYRLYPPAKTPHVRPPFRPKEK